jgi:hypothetical protein
MNLPIDMLLKKKREYMDCYNKYNNRYRLLQESPYLIYLNDHGLPYVKYCKDMRDVYKKKVHEMSMIIHRKRFP